MLKAAFILLRILTAIASLAALAGTVFALLVTSAFVLLKDGGHIFMTMARFFASGLRNPGPMPSNGPNISLPLAGLAVLFLTMFTSVFTPGEKLFLHIVAGMAVIATIWTAWTMAAGAANKMLYLPVIALWFVYYAVCLRRSAILELGP
jgi:hypothetical protein